jgi:hypothetical protein
LKDSQKIEIVSPFTCQFKDSTSHNPEDKVISEERDLKKISE